MHTRTGVASALLLCLGATAQDFNAAGVIQTRPGVDPSQFTVEISGSSGSLAEQRIGVARNGRFEARNLPRGSYTIRVVDERGATVGTSFVQAGAFAPVEIHVMAGIARTPAGPARAVSVQSLRADPDGKAEREFKYGLWEANTKDWKNAAKHFDKALRIDERYTAAAANWAAMEFLRGDHAQAEAVARRGLLHAPSNARLLHALGVSLIARGQITDEAVDALATAGREIPKLLLMAAETELKRGNPSQSRRLAEDYLKSGDTEFAAVATKLKMLAEPRP